MAQTGEKYTDARRALLASGGDSGRAGGGPGVAILWPDDSLGWFTDQAYNLILLAEDEARMMSHSSVEPEHLLLATTRRGNVQRLLAGLDHAIHDLILRINGFGEKLELRPRRSPASEEVLRRAVVAAADRGVLGPSTEHLLLALGEQERSARILGELGITDAQALVDAKYPVTRPPIDPALVQVRAAQLAARGQTPPSPGPIPPIFERFTSNARDALNAGIAHARTVDAPYVELAHLLYGVLESKDRRGRKPALALQLGPPARTIRQATHPGQGPPTYSVMTRDASSPRTCSSSLNVSATVRSPPATCSSPSSESVTKAPSTSCVCYPTCTRLRPR